jgi:hypothetical protein
VFLLFTFEGTFTPFFKDKKSKRSQKSEKQYESRFFLLFCLMIYQDPDRYLAYPACSRGTVKNSSFCAISKRYEVIYATLRKSHKSM